MNFENDFAKDYEQRSAEYMNNIDFRRLDEIKSKELNDITEADMFAIGFVKVSHEEFDNLFFYEDLNGIKVYINKEQDKVELRGFQLRKAKDINSTEELLDETLTKWRLKMK